MALFILHCINGSSSHWVGLTGRMLSGVGWNRPAAWGGRFGAQLIRRVQRRRGAAAAPRGRRCGQRRSGRLLSTLTIIRDVVLRNGGLTRAKKCAGTPSEREGQQGDQQYSRKPQAAHTHVLLPPGAARVLQRPRRRSPLGCERARGKAAPLAGLLESETGVLDRGPACTCSAIPDRGGEVLPGWRPHPRRRPSPSPCWLFLGCWVAACSKYNN